MYDISSDRYVRQAQPTIRLFAEAEAAFASNYDANLSKSSRGNRTASVLPFSQLHLYSSSSSLPDSLAYNTQILKHF